MKARFDAGTDVVLLGVWDPQRRSRPRTRVEEERALPPFIKP